MLLGYTLEPSAVPGPSNSPQCIQGCPCANQPVPKARKGEKRWLQARVSKAGVGRRIWGCTNGFVAVSKREPCLTPGSSCSGLLQAAVPWSFLPFPIPDESRLGGSREAFQRNLYMSCQETGQSMSQARPPMLQTHGSLTNMGQMYCPGLYCYLGFVWLEASLWLTHSPKFLPHPASVQQLCCYLFWAFLSSVRWKINSLHECWVLGSIVSQLLGLAVSCGTSCRMTGLAHERQMLH